MISEFYHLHIFSSAFTYLLLVFGFGSIFHSVPDIAVKLLRAESHVFSHPSLPKLSAANLWAVRVRPRRVRSLCRAFLQTAADAGAPERMSRRVPERRRIERSRLGVRG